MMMQSRDKSHIATNIQFLPGLRSFTIFHPNVLIICSHGGGNWGQLRLPKTTTIG